MLSKLHDEYRYVRDHKQQFNTCLQLVRTPLENLLMAMKKRTLYPLLII